MVKAIIDISEGANRVLNMVKAKYGLNDKSEAINVMAEEYGDELLEPELRPEFIEKMGRIQKEPAIKIGSISDLRKRYER